MLNDLDETIKNVLNKRGRLDTIGVEITFDIPTREWSSRISNPTINCYLFDIHERRVLREEGWSLQNRGTTKSARVQPPLFFEISYLITAWTANHQVDDEHRLLWQVLETLMDLPVLSEDTSVLHGSLASYEWPIHTAVAQLEGVLKSPGEFWTALENQLKPSISYTVTLGRMRRPRPTNAPPVLSTGLRLRLPEATTADGFVLHEVFQLPPGANVAGVVVAARGIPEDRDGMSEAEREELRAAMPQASATSDADGRVRFALPPGRYTLEAELGGEKRRRTVIISADTRAAATRGLRDVVRDQQNQGIPGVWVEVEGLGLQTVTDASGQFSFDLPPGNYTLLVHQDGWHERRQVTVRDTAYTMRFQYGGVPPGDD
jgi:hypothetical protein